MRLKEIKPGMAIHCKNDEEKKALLEEAERLGYKWSNTCVPTDSRMVEIAEMTIHFYGKSEYANFKHITWSDKTDGVTEFSDLILPELTAEELLQVINDICNTYSNCSCDCKKECPFCNGYCKEWMAKHPKDTIEICAQWKSDHEKNEPEIETVDVCRIIEIQPDGRKWCVHEEYMENIPIEEGKVRPSDWNIQKRCREILKRYCMEHDGEFIAVHEVVSRVKKVI